TSSGRQPYSLPSGRKRVGEIDGRERRGALFPDESGEQHATTYPFRCVEWIPLQTAVQSPAYVRAATGKYLPPIFAHCGLRKYGLFGSFHASHLRTAGSTVSSLRLNDPL